MEFFVANGITASNLCQTMLDSADADWSPGSEMCDYTDSDNVFTALVCLSTCSVPDCGANVNPIAIFTEGAFDECTDEFYYIMELMSAEEGADVFPEGFWEYLCSFGTGRRRLSAKGGAKHVPTRRTLQLMFPAVKRAVAKAVATARNLAK